MKIGLISDTHKKIGRAVKCIDLLIENGAEYIIHAGDIVKVEVLEYLRDCKVDYKAVYGNNDKHLFIHHKEFNLVEEPYYWMLGDKKIKLMHKPYYLSADADIIIHGHTHEVLLENNNGKLYINPGESCARDTGISNAMLLDINKNEYTIKHFYREIKTNIWDIKEYSGKLEA